MGDVTRKLGIGWALAVAALSASVAAQTPAAIKVESPTLEGGPDHSHGPYGRREKPLAGADLERCAHRHEAVRAGVRRPGRADARRVRPLAGHKIPGTATGLPADLPMEATLSAPAEIAGTIQGLSGFRRAGYRGPAPPPGKPHHYTFTVYALDAELPLEPGLNRAQLMEAIKGHIIGQGALVAIYERGNSRPRPLRGLGRRAFGSP